jgi:hypothetical protein
MWGTWGGKEYNGGVKGTQSRPLQVLRLGCEHLPQFWTLAILYGSSSQGEDMLRIQKPLVTRAGGPGPGHT